MSTKQSSGVRRAPAPARKKSKRKRQKPLRLTFALVPHTLYPNVVHTLFDDLQYAIFMWAACSHKPGKLLSSGFMSRQTGFPVAVCTRILADMTATRMVEVVYASTHPESVLYAVKDHICVSAAPRKKPTVYQIRTRKRAPKTQRRRCVY